mmetsp:Transcript_35125/g.35761  ORF Transcript_35125/g.35761 Transcript_35125/m.35761 type:complete len:332 (-) Transcript_35125:153-1148(-)
MVAGKADGAGKPKVAEKAKVGALTLVMLFLAWYGFNAGYNVYNSYVKQAFQYPAATSVVQLAVGLAYAIPLWIVGVRKVPNISFQDLLKLLPIALLNASGHAFTVFAMFQKGGGSFTHVIKASEPVVSVILGLGILGNVPKPLTAISLLPISYGVAYASTLGNLNIASMSKELTTLAAKLAMGSNIMFALRSIVRKGLTAEFKTRTNLDAANEHAVTTLLSTILLLPFFLMTEGLEIVQGAYNSMEDKQGFLLNLTICGMCYYLYNEMQNIVLASLGPVPTAVGNTLKRVVIFVALYFCTQGETFPLPKVIGCAIAIAGCLAFAIFDSKKW